MKVLRFKGGKPEWLIPMNELPVDMKRMLHRQWREFINELGDVDGRSIAGEVDPVVVERLERLFRRISYEQ